MRRFTNLYVITFLITLFVILYAYLNLNAQSEDIKLRVKYNATGTTEGTYRGSKSLAPENLNKDIYLHSSITDELRDIKPVETMTPVFDEEDKKRHLKHLEDGLALVHDYNWEDFLEFIQAVQFQDNAALSVFLIQAASQGAPAEVIIELLNNGAELTQTLLRIVVFSGKYETLERLERFGLNIYDVDEDENTALHYLASFPSNPEMVDYLLSKGYHDTVNINQEGALDVAIAQCMSGRDSSALISILLKHGFTEHQNYRYNNISINDLVDAKCKISQEEIS